MRDGWAQGVRGGGLMASSTGERQRALRAAGLCTICGKRPATGWRCAHCRLVLAHRRYGSDISGGGRAVYGQPPATLADVAAVLGLTRERCRQLQERALDKMATRMRTSREDALRGLAILGCIYGEVA